MQGVIAAEVMLDVAGVHAEESSGLVSNAVMLLAWRNAMADGVDWGAPAVRQLRPSGGMEIPSPHRERFESAFDYDFSHVRVHLGSQSAQAAEALEAHAFALGAHLFFGPGEWAPGTPGGDRILAHELTHVQQHDRGELPHDEGVSDPSDRAEVDAYANEDRILSQLSGIGSADLAGMEEEELSLEAPESAEDVQAEGAGEPSGGDAPEDPVSGDDGPDAPAMREAKHPSVLDKTTATELIRRSRGAPLPPAIAGRMAAVLGHDFSKVRVHTDADAVEAADRLDARAFALGSHVFFAEGAWAPGTSEGDERIAHELTHVVQHDEGRLPAPTSELEVSSPEDAAEREATETAAGVTEPGPVEHT
ncbi:MAG: DUF4157 domain-containing protein, partial [Deltaproteobacteria bacterium]|nr:DUF4157 domain-containing protein [Deltaproteobacteria bacterium]